MKNNIFIGMVFVLLGAIFFISSIIFLFSDYERATPCAILCFICVYYIVALEKNDK